MNEDGASKSERIVTVAELIDYERRETEEYFDLVEHKLERGEWKKGNVWKALTWSRFRRRQPHLLPRIADHSLKQIERQQAKEKPVRVVAIAFSFRSPKLQGTNRILPDASEFWAIAQRVRESHVVEMLYPPGLEFTILTESEAVAQIFGVGATEWQLYLHGIQKFIDVLGAPVRLMSLKEVADRTPSFWRIHGARYRYWRKFWKGIGLRERSELFGEERAAPLASWYVSFFEAMRRSHLIARHFPDYLPVSLERVDSHWLTLWQIQEGCRNTPGTGAPVWNWQTGKKRIVPRRNSNRCLAEAVPCRVPELEPDADEPFFYRK